MDEHQKREIVRIQTEIEKLKNKHEAENIAFNRRHVKVGGNPDFPTLSRQDFG